MTTVSALQTTLAAEHAAVYVYAVLGAQTSRSSAPDLFAAISAAYTEHRARRDVLTRAVTDAGEQPEAAAPAYELPAGLDRQAVVTRTAREIEERCAATYAALVASTEGDRRRWAIGALNDAAVRVLAFRGTPEMLPGADEYTDR